MRSDGCVMPDKSDRIYWDACVFLAYINGDDGRADVIQQLLDEAAEGAFELVTSTVSQVEVAFGKQNKTVALPTMTYSQRSKPCGFRTHP